MSLRRLTRLGAGDRGQALVELALILPIFLLLVFGSLEIGRVMNAWIMVTQASREGARVSAAQCSRNPACSALVDTDITNALSGLSLTDSRWSMTAGPYAAGDTVTITVDHDVTLVTPLISAFFGGGLITVHGQTSMRLE